MSNDVSDIPIPPEGSILALGRVIVPLSFEEKLAQDIRTCASSGKQVTIAYHTFGESSNPMVLLIPGLNAQSVVNYDSATCTWLSQQGFYVVRMDNRDTGRTTKFDDVPQRLNIPYFMLPNWLAIGEKQPYTLNDMADDCTALIKLLSATKKAHVVGVSMGGMIAQCIGLRNPEVVLSLTLIMTHSGNARVAPPPFSTLIGFLYKPKSTSVEDLNAFRRWFIDTYLVGEAMKDRTLVELTEKEFTRGIYLYGIKRQMAAIQRAPSRDADLPKLGTIPTHIIHGALDRLVPVGNGYHLHNLIPNSKLTVFPKMGHYVDGEHVQVVIEALTNFLRQNTIPNTQ